ncbi:MAG: discoidin domain-containing protein [Prevotellaceae bacterium]|nr:discoidin domain-containing protein [Prevotellaceae bacterium]
MKRIYFFLLVMPLCTLALAASSVEKLNPTTVEVTLQDGNRMYIDFYGPSIFRLFLDPQGGMVRPPEARPEANILVDNPRRDVSVNVQGNEFGTNLLTLTVDTTTGALEVSRKDGRKLSISAPEFQRGKTTLKLSQSETDYFFGGGVQNGRFSHRGKIIAIENTNNWVDGGVASPCPFFWSTGGYGVMAYTFRPGRYDFGATEPGTTVLTHETDYLDYFFMFDMGCVALLNDFYQLTGNPVLLPKFGFYEGHLNAYNRDYWLPNDLGSMEFEDGKTYSESQTDNGGIKESLNGELDNYQFSARAAIDRYQQNDMPLGWFLPNDGYGAGYGQTETLDGNIQNLREFGDYARSKGVEIGLWTQSDLHPKEGVEALLQRDIVKEVRDAGVRVLKTDVAWVGAGYSFGLNGVADVAEIMPYYGDNARPFIISLDGWAGTQRYAGIWSGDQTGGEWEYIRFHIPTYIGSGLSGQPNITSDMDGIFGGRNMAVNVRDFQWKAFSPMQLNMDGWGSNPKYPQALGEPATSINRWYLKLKSRLLPYTYSIAHEAVAGKPMIRAMFLEDENDFTLGTGTQYQFMYGPSILVAPIYKATRPTELDDVRDGIYLPEGNWIDYFTGDVYAGGRIINDFDAPLWKLPVFIKQGAIIPTHKPTNNPSEANPHLRCYDFYPATGNFTFTEYDDDGRTQAYLGGECVTTYVSQALDKAGRLTVQVLPAKGSYEGYEPRKSTQLRIYCESEPKHLSVKCNGKKLALTRVDDYSSWKRTPNSYYFGKGSVEHIDMTALMVNVAETNVQENALQLYADCITLGDPSKALIHTGALPMPEGKADSVAAYTITPRWTLQPNADYYEISFQGQTYSNIKQASYTLENLTPETNYTLQLRSVNKDGQSQWLPLNATTTADPLQFAIHGIRGETNCSNQRGQGINHFFDFDETTTWHTLWQAHAVPFDLIVDLRSVNVLDKLQYLPRPDAGNGTLLGGSVEYSLDRNNWTSLGDFDWERNGEAKEMLFDSKPTARYLRLHVTDGVGGFGSGQQLYVFRVPGSEWYIPGDINQDGRIDENDLTSYMNYTGLRKGDSDYEGYISKGDLNENGLIDVYDISAVATELESGISSRLVPNVAGNVSVETEKVGDELHLVLRGEGLVSVNGISLCVPYNTDDYEYLSVEPMSVSQMQNMTYDRLHSNGQKALYPTFVNLGEEPYTEGDVELMTIRFRIKHSGKAAPKVQDGMLVDKYMNVVPFPSK